MTPPPVPPHERAWRHPSEMGRAVHEPARARSHLLIVSTAVAGLAFVAVLAVSMTPSEVASPAGTGGAGTLASTAMTGLVMETPPTSAITARLVPFDTGLVPSTRSRPAAGTASTTERAVTDTTPALATTSATLSVPPSMAPGTSPEVVTSASAATSTGVATSEIGASASIGTGGPVLTDAAVLSVPVPAEQVLAIPMGSDGLALAARTGDGPVVAGDSLTAHLPSGQTVDVVVMTADAGGLVVVSVPGSPQCAPTDSTSDAASDADC